MTYSTANSRAMYRERTAEQERSPINSVAFHYTFLCPDCQQIKPRKGRVSRGHKIGFRCLECHEKRAGK